MLSPSDFNNAVPQFTNGTYASNPINPQYVNEPDSTEYNHGVEPLQTLPAQWWNWFINKFTGRFNKINTYVKNIFNELTQLLSLANITPDGTEATPTTCQLKDMFACCYPDYVKCCTTGTACGCIPVIGTDLGTTNNNILVTDASGHLKPSGIPIGSAAGCDIACFTTLGNTAGCGLCWRGSAGCCGTAARSDHIHPLPGSFGVYPTEDGQTGGDASIKSYSYSLVCLQGSYLCIDGSWEVHHPTDLAVQCADCATCATCATSAGGVTLVPDAICFHKVGCGTCCCSICACNLCPFPVIAMGEKGIQACRGNEYINIIGKCFSCCQKVNLGCLCSGCGWSVKVPGIRVY